MSTQRCTRCDDFGCYSAARLRLGPEEHSRLVSREYSATHVLLRPEAYRDWRGAAQALALAHHVGGPARKRAINALLYLTGAGSIGEALAAAAREPGEAVLAVYWVGELDAELSELLSRGTPDCPESGWDPWRAVELVVQWVKKH